MTVFRLILRHRLLTILAFPLIWLSNTLITFLIKTILTILRTWNLFLELPGRVKSLFSPILRLPSLMLEEVEVNGSGAATLDSFYSTKD